MATTREIREPMGRTTTVGSDRALGKGMPFRMSWGALFAGTVAALGIWILLYTLGVALGLSTVTPGEPGSLRASGVFTGVWSLVTPLIALFVGGMIAARSVGPLNRLGGGVHGLLVWSLTAVAGVYLIANLFGGVIGGAVDMTRTAAAAAQAIGQGDTTAAQPEGGVQGLAESVQQQLPGGEQIGQTATEAAPEAGRAFGVAFGALLLGLIAAVLGGVVGVSREQRRLAEELGYIPVTGLGDEAEARMERRRPAMGGVREGVVVAGGERAEAAEQRATVHERPSEPQVEQLRQELAQLRSEVREVLVRTEDLRH
jgi:hypothetical protein